MWIVFCHSDYWKYGDNDIYGEYDNEQEAVNTADKLNEDDMDMVTYWVEGPFFGPIQLIYSP